MIKVYRYKMFTMAPFWGWLEPCDCCGKFRIKTFMGLCFKCIKHAARKGEQG